MKHIAIVILMLMAVPALAGPPELTGGAAASQDDIDTYQYMVRLEGEHGPLAYVAERAYGKTVAITTKDFWLLAFGYDIELNGKWALWFDERYSQSLAVPKENLAGGGPKYYIYRSETTDFSFSAGVLHRWVVGQDGQEEESAVYSLRPKVKYETDTIKLVAVVFYIQNAADSDDVTKRGRLSVSFKDGAKTSFGLVLEGVKRTGSRTRTTQYFTGTRRL